MNKKIRKAQQKFLKGFAEVNSSFALAGGTALELYYLQHRFSFDLDFFSIIYNFKEIEKIINSAQKYFRPKITLENEFNAAGHAKVRFYIVEIKGSSRPLKVDFVQDVFLDKPEVKKIKDVKVYGVEDIYLQKIIAISGLSLEVDQVGRQIFSGRRKIRDAFDLYMLSKKVKPLSEFLKDVPANFQRGIIHWYRSFSRREFKLSLLDLDIYDKNIDSKKIIIYLENQIKSFIAKQLR
jgi:predicted nucleotidyltransferase component of viral defense system